MLQGEDDSTNVQSQPDSRSRPGNAGREVLRRPLEFFYRELERQGHPADLLEEGVGLTRKELCRRTGRIDWETFRRFLSNVGKVWDDDELVEAGKRMTCSPWQAHFASVVSLLFSTRGLYRYVLVSPRGIAKQCFSCMNNAIEEVEPNRMIVTATMEPGYERCRELDLMCKGSLMMMPRLVGQPESQVTMTELDDCVRYDVRYHATPSLRSRIRRALLWPFAARKVASELKEASEELFERSAELASETTSRAHAEEALRESESRFSAAFDAAPVWMVISSVDGRILGVNESLLTTFCETRERLIGRDLGALELWKDPAHCHRLLKNLSCGVPVRSVEVELVGGDGHTRFALVSAASSTLGNEECFIWQAIDITERKLAQEDNRRLQESMLRAQKLESLGVLAGGIAHDFNNILVGIRGNAELAQRQLGKSNPPVEARLAAIQEASERAAELTEEMLAYAGMGGFKRGKIEFGTLVEQTAELTRSGLRNATVVETLIDARDVWIYGDETQIRQVIMNLITNAAESYGEEGGRVVVRVGIVYADRSKLEAAFLRDDLPAAEYASVRVSDRGCGMNEETLGRIFDPFFTTKFSGRGLGLAATHRIVNDHAGALRVESKPGKGTVFELLFPRTPAPSEPASPPAAVQLVPESEEGLILVVDDEEPVRTVGQAMLEHAGYRTLAAGGGKQALELFRSHAGEITAVLLDLTMPEMNGRQVFKRLRELRADLPIVCYSGFGDEVGLSWIAGRPHTAFLPKPFAAARLLSALREVAQPQPQA